MSFSSVHSPVHSLGASEAANRLGVSIKALRLYERRGLLTPARTAAGYRLYGPGEIARAAEIVALRALGLSLSQVARVLEGDRQSVDLALAAHETTLDAEIRALATAREKVRALRADVLVIDMVEQGLDSATQDALITNLRQRAKAGARPLFLMTRSSAILDLAAMGPDETILFCPANHSPPIRVTGCPGAPGYEAVATCLASPEVRARTAGMIARIVS